MDSNISRHLLQDALSEEKEGEYIHKSRYMLQDVDIRCIIGGEKG